MRRFLGITGTPGTGKKSIAPGVASILGLPCVGLNDLLTAAERRRASEGVDPRKLRARLVNRVKGGAIVFGHLLPDALDGRDLERVVVLRCEPAVLRRRLGGRGYSRAKLASNVEAELIGVVSARSVSRFGGKKVVEYDTSGRDVRRSVKDVARLLRAPTGKGALVDWVPLYSSAEKLRSLLSVAKTESAFT